MKESTVRILGVSGSPIKEGNVDTLLQDALAGQSGVPGVDCEMVRLSGLDISDCRQCNWCLKKQVAEKYCCRDDDMRNIYPKIDSADVLVFATPVYFGRLSGHLASFIDRLRVYMHGNISHGLLRDKVGATMAVAWFRMGGLEIATATLNQFFFSVNMVIAAPELGLAGATAFSSLEGTGRRMEEDRLLVMQDELGVASARSAVARAVELSRLLQAGKDALGV
jgi:multimeric flavodoxin WrbA